MCAAAGAELADAVRLGVYVTDMGTFPEVNEAYAALLRRGAAGPQHDRRGLAAAGREVEIDAIVALAT